MLHLLSSEVSALLTLWLLLVCSCFFPLLTLDYTLDSFLRICSFAMVLRTLAAGRSCSLISKDAGKKRVILLFGANGVLGSNVSRLLLESGATILVSCRNRETTERTTKSLQLTVPGSVVMGCGNVDFTCKQSMSDFIAHLPLFLNRHALQLDTVVITVAAICPRLTYVRFGEGTVEVEKMLAGNSVGVHFMAKELIPILEKSFEPRLIIVASSCHTYLGIRPLMPTAMIEKLHNANAGSFFSPDFVKVYGLSKLLNIYSGTTLAEREQKKNSRVKVVLVHPGVFSSGLYRNILPAPILTAAFLLLSLVLKNGTQAAQSVLQCCLEQHSALIQGGYYYECREYGVLSPVRCSLSLVARCTFEREKAVDWMEKCLDEKV